MSSEIHFTIKLSVVIFSTILSILIVYESYRDDKDSFFNRVRKYFWFSLIVTILLVIFCDFISSNEFFLFLFEEFNGYDYIEIMPVLFFVSVFQLLFFGIWYAKSKYQFDDANWIWYLFFTTLQILYLATPAFLAIIEFDFDPIIYLFIDTILAWLLFSYLKEVPPDLFVRKFLIGKISESKIQMIHIALFLIKVIIWFGAANNYQYIFELLEFLFEYNLFMW